MIDATLRSHELRTVPKDKRRGDMITHVSNTVFLHLLVVCAVKLLPLVEKRKFKYGSIFVYTRSDLTSSSR